MQQQQEYHNNNNLRSNFTSSSPGLLQNISPNHYLNTNNNHVHSSKRHKHENLTLDVTNKEFSKYLLVSKCCRSQILT
jgi:hypothetical protein